MRRLAALAAAVLAGGAAPMTLQCRLDPASGGALPDWGGSFTATVPFGEGVGLALVDPESQKVQRMAHGADVLDGAFAAGDETAILVWTRATSARAALIGQAIRGDGHLLTISVARAGAGDAPRAVQVYDTRPDQKWTGACSVMRAP